MKTMRTVLIFCLACTLCLAAETGAQKRFQDSFPVDKGDLSSVGTNPYFVLMPGFQLTLRGKEDGKATELTISVLDQMKIVDGVETRIVEEKETADGRIIEISRNYFAISRQTHDLFYFGEDVDIYKDGKVANHEGAWLSGVAGAHFGLMLPGTPVVGARFYQELAPGVAMDRSEIVSLNETITTPAGKFERCLKTEETTPLEKGKAHKLYAPNIGVVSDGELTLVKVLRPLAH